MNILIVYGSTDGQTEKICQFMSEEIEKAGHKATVSDADKIWWPIDNYDLYIVGASIHIGSYQKSVRRFVSKHCEMLNKKPSAFISVSLTAAGSDHDAHVELNKITKEFLSNATWRPDYTIQVAGALMYSKYNFVKKFIMKRISKSAGGDTDTSKDYEYTNWDQVSDFVRSTLKDHVHTTNKIAVV